MSVIPKKKPKNQISIASVDPATISGTNFLAKKKQKNVQGVRRKRERGQRRDPLG
jgi:hypothetical protein